MSVADLDVLQKQLQERMIKVISALLSLAEDRDPRLYALLSGLPPPKKLIRSRARLIAIRNVARSEKLRNVLDVLINVLDRYLDMFQKLPVFIEQVLSKSGTAATSEEEMEVIVE